MEVVRRSQAVSKAASRMKDSAGIDEDVPKVAFMRVNIMDVLEYDDKEKQASVKLYLEVAWRRKDAQRHHLKAQEKKDGEAQDGKAPSNATEVKWTNADEKADNDVPPDFYKACPVSFSKKHPISDLLDNYIPSADTETWHSWFQVDDGSEARFETMGEPLDPNCAEMQMQSVHSLSLAAYPLRVLVASLC
jgi:hypothetical protein